MASTSAASRQFQVLSTTVADRPQWSESRTLSGTSGHGFVGERTSSGHSTSTTTVSPGRVKSPEQEEDRGSTRPQYVAAVALNVALLAGIVVVVVVFVTLLLSLLIYRRRRHRRHGDIVTSTPTATTASGVPSRPRIKPAYEGFPAGPKHASVCLPTDGPRLFVSVSKVGDPKEWFV